MSCETLSTLQGTSVHYLGYPGDASAYEEGGAPGVAYTYRGQGQAGGLGDAFGGQADHGVTFNGPGGIYGGPGDTFGSQGTVYVPAGRRGEVDKTE